MLERFTHTPASAELLRSSRLGAHLDEFCAGLVAHGYRALTIRHKLWVVASLARWMTKEELAVVDLDERRVDEFLEAQRRRGLTCRGYHHTVLQLIDHLRTASVVPAPAPTCDDSPSAALLKRYGDFLRQERGLAQGTISAYLVCRVSNSSRISSRSRVPGVERL